MSYWKWSIISD